MTKRKSPKQRVSKITNEIKVVDMAAFVACGWEGEIEKNVMEVLGQVSRCKKLSRMPN